MDTIEVLIAARAEVEKGWAQGSLCDENSNVCMGGAVFVACGVPRHQPFGYQTTTEPWLALQALHTLAGGNFVNFNNAPETTKADVLHFFDDAINSLVPVGDTAHVHRTAA